MAEEYLGKLLGNTRDGTIYATGDPSHIWFKSRNYIEVLFLGTYDEWLNGGMTVIFDSTNLTGGHYYSDYGDAYRENSPEGIYSIRLDYSSVPPTNKRIFYVRGRLDPNSDIYNETEWYSVNAQYYYVIQNRDTAVKYDITNDNMLGVINIPTNIRLSLGFDIDILSYLLLTGALDNTIVYIYPGNYGFQLNDNIAKKLENVGLSWRPFNFVRLIGREEGQDINEISYCSAKDVILNYGGYITEGNINARGITPPLVFNFVYARGLTIKGNIAMMGGNYFSRIIWMSTVVDFNTVLENTSLISGYDEYSEPNVSIAKYAYGSGIKFVAHRSYEYARNENRVMLQIPYLTPGGNEFEGIFSGRENSNITYYNMTSDYSEGENRIQINAPEIKTQNFVFSNNVKNAFEFGEDKEGNEYSVPGPYLDRIEWRLYINPLNMVVKKFDIPLGEGSLANPTAYETTSNQEKSLLIEYAKFEPTDTTNYNLASYNEPTNIPYCIGEYGINWDRQVSMYSLVNNYYVPIKTVSNHIEKTNNTGICWYVTSSFEWQEKNRGASDPLYWYSLLLGIEIYEQKTYQKIAHLVVGEGTSLFSHCDFINIGKSDVVFTHHPIMIANRYPTDSNWQFHQMKVYAKYSIFEGYKCGFSYGEYLKWNIGGGRYQYPYYQSGYYTDSLDSNYFHVEGTEDDDTIYRIYRKGITKAGRGEYSGYYSHLTDPKFVDLYPTATALVDTCEADPDAYNGYFDWGALEPNTTIEGTTEDSDDIIDAVDDAKTLLNNEVYIFKLYDHNISVEGDYSTLYINAISDIQGVENLGIIIKYDGEGDIDYQDKYINPFRNNKEIYYTEQKSETAIIIKRTSYDSEGDISHFDNIKVYVIFGTKYIGSQIGHLLIHINDGADPTHNLLNIEKYQMFNIKEVIIDNYYNDESNNFTVNIPVDDSNISFPCRIHGIVNWAYNEGIITDDFEIETLDNNEFILLYKGGELCENAYITKHFKVVFKTYNTDFYNTKNICINAFVPGNKEKVFFSNREIAGNYSVFSLDSSDSSGDYTALTFMPTPSIIVPDNIHWTILLQNPTYGWQQFSANTKDINKLIIAPENITNYYGDYEDKVEDIDNGGLTITMKWNFGFPIWRLPSDIDKIYDEPDDSNISPTDFHYFVEFLTHNVGKIAYLNLGNKDVNLMQGYNWLLVRVKSVKPSYKTGYIVGYSDLECELSIIGRIK